MHHLELHCADTDRQTLSDGIRKLFSNQNYVNLLNGEKENGDEMTSFK